MVCGCIKYPPSMPVQLINYGDGLLDIAMASYNYFVQEELPRMINELRPIVWVIGVGGGSLSSHTAVPEKQDNTWLSINIQTHFTCVEKPMLNPSQIILPLQAQQLGRSYTGRLLVHVEIGVKQTVAGQVVQQFAADIHGHSGCTTQHTRCSPPTSASVRSRSSLAPACVTVPWVACPRTSLSMASARSLSPRQAARPAEVACSFPGKAHQQSSSRQCLHPPVSTTGAVQL